MSGRAELVAAQRQNERLARTLAAAREQLAALKEQVEALAHPPSSLATILAAPREDGTVEVVSGGRRLQVAVSPDLGAADLLPGREALLNDGLVLTEVLGQARAGEVVTLGERLGEDRAVVLSGADTERVVLLAASLGAESLRPGDAVLLDPRAGIVTERLDRPEVSRLVLGEVPDVDFDDIGGLAEQIEQVRDAVELPFLHADLFEQHRLAPPRGVLLHGPPGTGKTMIAKAVAASLARRSGAGEGWFLSIKGPELLTKFVGETERHVRLVFERAREKAAGGAPVVVFFDEMESLFRTRGSGVSSDVETTVVPQLLAEIDGVEGLKNVIVIGASNRQDLIDPAILRPGRLDVKVRVDRPDAAAAGDILRRYLVPDLPFTSEALASAGGDAQLLVDRLIAEVVDAVYARDEASALAEVVLASGAVETLHLADLASGALLANVVDRAKTAAVKRLLATGQRGLDAALLRAAVAAEAAQNESLTGAASPDDWARITGRRGERVVAVRPLGRAR